ncbi:COQ9 family protein [Altererythrobacter soli]|uniref:COQ9 family protein n=1 Tax=Croceibacterium soli TaxID=1739690 RepID=A0A6I4UUA8_9SPHN|nr:COQ9 family protein [Croceibacterium soli]MXP42106.1 COQ9 family protein [Croceibacterium soli]
MASAADLTLDELRLHLAPEIAMSAIFDGWSDAAVVSASEVAGVDPAVARLAFPGGAMDMIAAWIASVDAQMQAAFDREVLALMPIRERIRALVWFRIEAVAGLEEALRRALAIQAMPQNLARTAKICWASADSMWRLAGDTATDYNHYTKRAILASIYAATLTVFVEDESEGKAETRAFLDRRIEGVMKFEKTKAQLLRPRDRFDVMRFLGRLRYPAR